MRPAPVPPDRPRDALQGAVPLILASRNAGKLAELRRLLAPYPWRVLTATEADVEAELPEPGPGYADNAIAKALAVSATSGRCALGEDSGIEVEALRGWPGPESARWLGPHASDSDRLRGLLDEVTRSSPSDRRVRYVSAVALVRPDAEPVVAHGACEGLLVEPRGTGGFGYDPGFHSPELRMTFGEATAAQKDAVSHRARAIRRLAESGVLHSSVAYR